MSILNNMEFNYELACAIIIILALYVVYRRYTGISIADIRGPESPSYALGHVRELTFPECGIIESKWQAEFGSLFRIKGGFGEDRLYVADPKALQHILQKGGYDYLKVPGDNNTKALSGGRGLFWAENEVHRHYRKAVAGIPEPKEFLPVFYEIAKKTVDKWRNILASASSEKPTVLDLNLWMSKAALDVIGLASFDHDFKFLDNVQDPLRIAYESRTGAFFNPPSYVRLLFESIHNDIPPWILDLIHRYWPFGRFAELQRTTKIINDIIGEAFQNRLRDIGEGKKEGKRDMMSLLVKSRLAGDKSRYLRDDELIAQVYSTIFGGHGTISLSMTWAIYEIAKRPDVQARMRSEVLALLAKVHARGDTECSILDLDGLHYTDAVIRETFRLQSIIVNIRRQAAKNDILPLQKPIVTKSGKVLNEVPIAKGTRLYISVHGYHINEHVWGDDVDEFKPERWFVNKNTTGLFGNVLNFSSGVKSCPGRRFSFVEMQAFFVILLSNFEFSIPKNAKRIVRQRGSAMLPLLEGETESGPQCPIIITPLST